MRNSRDGTDEAEQGGGNLPAEPGCTTKGVDMRRAIFIVLLIVAMQGCNGADRKQPIAKKNGDVQKEEERDGPHVPEFLKPLLTAETVMLYSIDPSRTEKTTEAVAGYGALGKIEIKDAETRRKMARALAGALDKNAGAKCFEPRHVLRATRGEVTVDFIICFECEQMEIWTGSTVRMEFIRGTPQELFDGRLRAAGIPITRKTSFTRDKDKTK